MRVSQMAVGEKLMFGRYSGMEIVWRKVAEANGFLAECSFGSLVADECEPENSNKARRERGSNFFPQTNVCTFLNSEEKDWYKPQHDNDAANEKMRISRGFLSEFYSWEKELIAPQELTIVVPDGYKRAFGNLTTVNVKVSIPSRSQIFGGDETEGTRFDLFLSEPPRRLSTFTRTAIGTGLCAVNQNGQLINLSPCKEFRCRPFLLIDPDAEVEFSAATMNYYVLPSKAYVKAVTDELHQILK